MAHPGQHELAPLRPRWRRAWWLVAGALVAVGGLVAVAALGWASPSLVAGRGSASTHIDARVSPDSIAQIPSGSFDTRMDSQEMLIAAIVADLNMFWSERLSSATGSPFEGLRGGITAMDSAADSGRAPCVSKPADIVGNAFYCPSNDGIVYDAAALVPVLLHRYGVGGLTSTIAHEYGHAVSERLDRIGSESEPSDGRPLAGEARADCYAGSFLSWAVSGDAPHLRFDESVLLGAIGPLVDFADADGVRPDDPLAHGLAIDRARWFSAGFHDGYPSCRKLDIAVGTGAGAGAGTGAGPDDTASPRFASRPALLTAAQESIDTFSGQRSREAAPPEILDAAAPFGQFAQATVLALAIGEQRTGTVAGAACFAGSWVRSLGHDGSVLPSDELGGRAGDANEGFRAVLLWPGATFHSASAYLDGLREGSAACR